MLYASAGKCKYTDFSSEIHLPRYDNAVVHTAYYHLSYNMYIFTGIYLCKKECGVCKIRRYICMMYVD